MEISKDNLRLEQDIHSALGYAVTGLLPIAATKVAESEAALFQPGNYELAIVLTTKFNCSVALKEDKSGFTLFMNYGLLKAFREMTRMFSRGMEVMSESQAKSEDFPNKGTNSKDVRFDESVVAKELMDAFWNTRLPNEEVIPAYELSEEQAMMHNLCLRGGIQFVIAHELAHVILDVCDEAARSLVPPSPKGHEVWGGDSEAATYRQQADSFAEEFLRSATDLTTEEELMRLRAHWGLEFAADRLGLEMSLETEKKWLPVFNWGAAEWFFILCDVLYRYHLATRDASIDVLATHPPPHLRLRHIREAFKTSSFPHDIGAAFKMRADMILEKLCPNAPRISVLGRKDAQEQEAALSYQDGLKAEASMAFREVVASQDLEEARDHFARALEQYVNLTKNADDKSEARRYVRAAADCFRACGRLSARLKDYRESARLFVQSFLIYQDLKDMDGVVSSGQEMRKLLVDAPPSALSQVKAELAKMGIEFKFESEKEGESEGDTSS